MRTRFAKVGAYTVIGFVMAVYLFPLLFTLNASLMTEAQFMQNPNALTETFRFQNFVDAWTRARFSNYVLNSLLYTTVATTVTMALNLLIAFPIARYYVKSAKKLYGMLLIGMFLPNSTTMLFVMMLNLNLYNTRLGYMLILMGVGGLTFLFFVSYIRSLPKELDEAASMDGCGYYRFLLTIIVPLMRPAIATMAILTAIGVWNDIMGAVIFLASDRLFPITRGLFVFIGARNIQWTLRISGLIIIAAPVIVLYVALQRHIIESVVSSGIKG